MPWKSTEEISAKRHYEGCWLSAFFVQGQLPRSQGVKTPCTSLGRITSMVGTTFFSLLTALFSCLRSTHIPICPFFLGTATMGAHHSCQLFYLFSYGTLNDSSIFTFDSMGTEMCLVVAMLYGTALFFKLICIGFIFSKTT